MFIIFVLENKWVMNMPRPQKNRIVSNPPVFSEFKPVGIASKMLEQVLLSLDEYEALRLADKLGMSHNEAAEEMEISRSTFTRLIEKARAKLVDFIVSGKLLLIDGGNIHFRKNIIKCEDCGHMFKIPFDSDIKNCPKCDSGRIINLAGGFGHGKCCIAQNKGGRHARKRQNRP